MGLQVKESESNWLLKPCYNDATLLVGSLDKCLAQTHILCKELRPHHKEDYTDRYACAALLDLHHTCFARKSRLTCSPLDNHLKVLTLVWGHLCYQPSGCCQLGQALGLFLLWRSVPIPASTSHPQGTKSWTQACRAEEHMLIRQPV